MTVCRLCSGTEDSGVVRFKFYVELGGLASYGPDIQQLDECVFVAVFKFARFDRLHGRDARGSSVAAAPRWWMWLTKEPRWAATPHRAEGRYLLPKGSPPT